MSVQTYPPVTAPEVLKDSRPLGKVALGVTVYPAITVTDSSAIHTGDAAGGDLSGTYPNPTVTALTEIETDITDLETLKAPLASPALTGSPTAPTQAATDNSTKLATDAFAVGADHVAAFGFSPGQTVLYPTLTVTDASAIHSGDSAGGDLTGTYPNPTLGTAGPGATGPLGSATVSPIVTIDAKGRVTALSSAAIAIAESAVTNLTTDLTNRLDLSQGTSNTVNVMTAATNIVGFRNYAAAAAFRMERVDGNAGAGTPIQSGDVLANTNYGGSTTSAANPTIYTGGAIRVTATETWDGTHGGAKIELRITPNTTHTITTVATFDQDSSLTLAGAVSGITTLAIGGALSGATTGAFSGNVTITAANLVTDTTTGMKIGGATAQKLGFWNATPIIQPASANQAAVGTTAPAGGTGAAAGGWDTAAHRDTAITTINSLVTLVNQMRSDLVAAGILKGSA